jgi:sugar (pentulose or hexulose) kinase
VTSANNSNLYMAVEFGLSHVKVTIGAPTGAPLESIKSPIDYFRPQDAPPTALEFNPAQALKLVISTAQSAIAESNISPADIAGIGVTSQRQGPVLLNLEGQPLYAGSNRDRRASAEGADVDSNALVDVGELTGHGPAMLTA